MFVQRYGEVARWRTAFLLFLALLAERGLRRAYLSWKESRLRPRRRRRHPAGRVPGMAARRELSLRRRAARAAAAALIQARWRARAAREHAAAVICQCAWRRRAARRRLARLRIEQERAAEACRLREMVDVLQQAVEDAEVRVIAEREAAKKAIAEAPPVIKEIVVQVVDTDKVDSLAAEVARLKVTPSMPLNVQFIHVIHEQNSDQRNRSDSYDP